MILEFIQRYQVYIMMSLSSVCFVLALLAFITKTLPKKRKFALVYIELSASMLLFFDRLSYFYSGDMTDFGFWMTRITNFIVFMVTLAFLHATNCYIADLSMNELNLKRFPTRLRIGEAFLMIGWFLVIVSQFTGFYYYFDENNVYHRGPGFTVSYIIPFVILALQLSVMINYYKRLNNVLRLSMGLFFTLPIIAAVMQFFYYGISFINISIVGAGIVLYIFAIKDVNDQVEQEKKLELDKVKAERTRLQKGFDEAATAIANAVDSRDEWSKGHSVRVADYSRRIAIRAGLGEQACHEVYYAGLLHDIGKIGLPETLVRKGSDANEADRKAFRQHTVIGGQILEDVKDYPYLPDAAKYHHERYDGNGYPEGLVGEHIPLYARIVKVADVYDFMTSHKKNRSAYPQGKVRETFVTGAHKQFDPKFAGIMVELIDEDTEYLMRETEGFDDKKTETVSSDLTEISEMRFTEYKENVSDGLKLTANITKLSLVSIPDEDQPAKNCVPSLIVFDSFDGSVHTDDRKIRNLHYYEFAEIWFDGHTISTRARNMKTTVDPENPKVPDGPVHYDIEAVRFKDHVKIKIVSKFATVESTISLFDTARSVYIGLAGEHSLIKDIVVNETQETIDENYIKRISGEIDVINLMDGDIPNVQIDEYRSATTSGVRVYDGMRLMFHSRTLPASNQVSNCPYVLLYSSEDGTVTGKNYKEYACIRIDGDDVTEVPDGQTAANAINVQRKDDFVGWDAWKQFNIKGFECEVDFRRKRNNITITTENAGVAVKCVTEIPKETDVFAALTGDRCALMDIRSLDA